jgi:hypothetical protein
MQIITDHLPQLLGVLAFCGGLIATWTRMTVKMSQLEKTVLENRNTMKQEFKRMEDDLNADLSRFKIEHDICRGSIVGHHENSLLHMTTQERELGREWRLDLTERLKRIESMIAEVRANHK